MTDAEPAGLGDGGRGIWAAYAGVTLSVPQKAILLEACRAKDRLDQLDLILRGDADVWARLVHRVRTEDYELHIDDALAKANTTAGSLRQLLAMLPAPAAEKARNALDELKKRREDRAAGTAGVPGTRRSSQRR